MRRYKCNVCAMLNDIPMEYFCNLDANGRRKDADERPELCCGTVEYIAPAEYMVRRMLRCQFSLVGLS